MGRRRIRKAEGLAFVVAVLGSVAPLAAALQCPNDGNLIENCSFDFLDTSLWAVSTDVPLVRSSTFANTGNYSGFAAAENVFGDRYGVGIEGCVPDVEPLKVWSFGAWVRGTTSGNTLLGLDCIVTVYEAVASDPPCQGADLNELNGSGTFEFGSTTFASVIGQDGFETGVGPSDIVIGLACEREIFDGGFELYIDDIFLMPTDTVYLAGFDAGDTCGWDESVGGGCP